MAQVPGHQTVALDDGQPDEEPTAVGGAATAGELRRAADGRVRGVGQAVSGGGWRGRPAAGTGAGGRASEPPGLVAGRHAGDGGQDGTPALGAVEPGAGHRDPGASGLVVRAAPRQLGRSGRAAAVHAAGAGGEPAPVHAGPDSVPGGGGGGPEPVAGLVAQ